jgi:hypothetical protein
MYHNGTAIAGASMSSTSSEGVGRLSPASIISYIYIPAASFILSKASCEEYPQLEQPGSAGIVALHRPSSSFRVTFRTKVFIIYNFLLDLIKHKLICFWEYVNSNE